MKEIFLSDEGTGNDSIVAWMDRSTGEARLRKINCSTGQWDGDGLEVSDDDMLKLIRLQRQIWKLVEKINGGKVR